MSFEHFSRFPKSPRSLEILDPWSSHSTIRTQPVISYIPPGFDVECLDNVECLLEYSERGFVNITAVWVSAGTNLRVTVPFLTSSRMKWNRMAICFTRGWFLVETAKSNAPRLSTIKDVDLAWGNPISWRSCRKNKISWTATDIAWYSASVLKSESLFCCFDHPEMYEPLKNNTPPVRERRLSGSSPHVASEKQVSFLSSKSSRL